MSIIALLALSMAQPVTADPTPPEEEAIVIEGLRPDQLDAYVRKGARAYTGDSYQRQLTRFHRPVCPMAVGLEEDTNSAIEQRMRALVAETELGVAPEGCSTNLLVVFTADREELFDYWDDNNPKIWFGLEPADLRRLERDDRPVVSWQLIELLDEDGQTIDYTVFLDGPLAGKEVRVVERTRGGSRLQSATRPTASAAVVVVDKAALDGLDVRQMADYAVMRAMVPVNVDRAQKLETPTILTLFDAGPDDRVRLSVSEWDFAFLKALYATDNIYYDSRQRAQIRDVVFDEIGAAGEAAGRKGETDDEQER